MSKIFVVGIGPGKTEHLSPAASAALQESDIIVGYNTYIELIKEKFKNKEFVSSPMTKEVERCKLVLDRAKEGNVVSLISSGDSGIYGMAGIMLEIALEDGLDIPVEIIPGITSASMSASILGSPLTNDFAVISLSDLLTPKDIIIKRLKCMSEGDIVVCIYNPKSLKRVSLIETAKEIFLKFRSPNTPVGIVRNAGRIGESHVITTLEKMLEEEIDMFTTVIVGNSLTYVKSGRMITPRGYQ